MENLVALVTAVAALVTACIGVAQIRLLRKQMEQDARPYLVADLVPGLHGTGSWDLVLHSTGRSTAHRVRVITDPALGTKKRDPGDYITDSLVKYLGQARSLPPGARRRVMWRSESGGEKPSGAPAEITVKVAYEDENHKVYTEEFDFDTGPIARAAPVPSEGPRKSGSEKGQELHNIDRAIRSLAKHVGELRR